MNLLRHVDLTGKSRTLKNIKVYYHSFLFKFSSGKENWLLEP